jgi:hypothetical protein
MVSWGGGARGFDAVIHPHSFFLQAEFPSSSFLSSLQANLVWDRCQHPLALHVLFLYALSKARVILPVQKPACETMLMLFSAVHDALTLF